MIKNTLNKILLIAIFLMPIGLIGQQKKISLNGNWAFRADYYNQGEAQKWFEPSKSNVFIDSIEVPGNWDLYNEYTDYAGKAWYRTSFMASNDWEAKVVRLVFQSVYHDSKVWLNGKLLGENKLGFLSFQFDIQKYLKIGEENTLVLQVDNTYKLGATWNWGGIRRPVWLEISQPVRIDYQHIAAIPDLKKGSANVDVKTYLSNYSNNEVKLELELSIEKEGKQVAKNTQKISLPGNKMKQEVALAVKLTKSKVVLWHFNSPHLYTSKLTLKKAGKVIYEDADRFGIRKVELDGLKLKLNGEEVRLVGFNLVPEDRFTGNTLPFERIKEDVDLMKECGANMARLSHMPLPKEFLDYLDEKGIMTFEEVSLWGKHAWVDPEHPMPKQFLSRLIEERFNHPSVIGWSVGNEIGGYGGEP